jgi:EAL domain-containing protein (putative c-di-GMP-specific phosphodiesterase class I)
MTATLHAALTSGIEPENFVFEVVESDEILDINALITILACCRDVGCRVALDDLGAGHSSLSLMTRIQPDFVKLDMELIRNVDRDEYKSCVAGKILEIARELGVKTVVEGVESELEWQWARDHGADFSQGFFFAAPQEKPPALRLSDPFANSAGDNRNSEYQSALESLVVQ